MIDGLPLSIIDLTASGLLGIGILLLFLGRLHTNTAYKTVERAYQVQVAAADRLRETNNIQARTIEKQNDIISKQQVVGDIVAKIMEAIQAENKLSHPQSPPGEAEIRHD